ncbi:precorrin-4 C(11)-methyltransferase [Thermodesulforhabdus norvegica]|uniref:Cobalt-precorrin 4 C11-methyltransferase n=1 Tax=Thermodesulforhabdus norvegica TaxID=39841 RepID=A0A1I4W6C6_9BACT|nr:precorrin-4 C(11)-methyltransferase [Thermodesulforhabdus norvegica]SFN09035.1 cobalt-precorrin 4 C11-methyltransferase [Thermodesulforhabdus norvegica]
MRAHPIYFIGAGPGDPELITVKGKRILETADRIVYAGSLVSAEMLKWAKDGAELIDSAPLTLEQTHGLLVEGYRKGLMVARLHSGDPGLYGAIHEQMVLLDAEGIPYEVVPGVSAVFAAAAALKRELTLPEISQTLIITRKSGKTPVPERESLASLASHRATVALYLSVHAIEDVVAELLKHYPENTPVVVAHRVSWPDESFIFGTLADIAERVKKAGIRRQALILVGESFAEERPGKRSRLYAPDFSHGFRKSRGSSA